MLLAQFLNVLMMLHSGDYGSKVLPYNWDDTHTEFPFWTDF